MAECSQLIDCIDKSKNTKFTELNTLLYGQASLIFASNNKFLILQFQTI